MQACIHSLEEALESCAQIGYPIMLKASWGGGGKGIRKVMNEDDVRASFKQVQVPADFPSPSPAAILGFVLSW